MNNMLYNLFAANSLNPMTSDSTNLVWLIPVAAVSLILLILLVLLGKKRK